MKDCNILQYITFEYLKCQNILIISYRDLSVIILDVSQYHDNIVMSGKQSALFKFQMLRGDYEGRIF